MKGPGSTAHRLQRLAERVVVGASATVLRRLPPRAAAALRERWSVHGRLDHPQHTILMGLESTAAWTRTFGCRKEPETVAWLESQVAPKDVLYDIGANVGAYSLLACALAECRVFAFEPSPASFAALASNCDLNAFTDRLAALNVALAEANGLARLERSRPAAGAALHSLAEVGSSSSGHGQAVATFRLDDLRELLDLPAPSLMKIDVDGAELRVLAGADRTLECSDLRSILVEDGERRDRAPSAIEQALLAKGFELASRHQRGPSGDIFNLIFERRPGPRGRT